MQATSIHYAVKQADGRYISKNSNAVPTYGLFYLNNKAVEPFTPDVLKARWFTSEKNALKAVDNLLADYDVAIDTIKRNIENTKMSLNEFLADANQEWIDYQYERLGDYDDLIQFYLKSKPTKFEIVKIESVHTF